MGMYDTVRCEYPLPNPADNDRHFQTKDLERTLARYTITREGALIEHLTEIQDVPEEERPYFNTENWPEYSWMGAVRAVGVGERPVPFKGILTIYDIRSDPPDEDGWCARTWIEYALTFDDARVVAVTDKSHPLEPARRATWDMPRATAIADE